MSRSQFLLACYVVFAVFDALGGTIAIRLAWGAWRSRLFAFLLWLAATVPGGAFLVVLNRLPVLGVACGVLSFVGPLAVMRVTDSREAARLTREARADTIQRLRGEIRNADDPQG